MNRMHFGLIFLLALFPLFALPLANGQTYTNRTSVYSGSFSLPSTAGVGCGVYLIPFNAAQGDFLSGSFNANNPVNLYIGSQEPVNNWARSAALCMGPPANILAIPKCNTIPNCTTKSSNFTLTMPQTGKWTIAFVGIQADINLNAILQTNTTTTTK